MDLAGGTYRFHVSHDDGVRLYIDNSLQLNAWNTCCVWNTVDVTLQAGSHTIRVEYFENDGAANIQVWWELLQQRYVSVGSQDGWILESTETSNVGGTKNNTATTLNVGDNAANKQYRSILSFDTSTVPDTAVITSVTLKFKYAGKTGTLPFSTHGKLLADVCKGSFKNDPILQLSDFNVKCPLGMYKSAGLSYTNSLVDSWYSQLFNPVDFTYVNLSGVTQVRLRFSKDDNNDLGADFLKIYSGNAYLEADRPQLVIEYYVP